MACKNVYIAKKRAIARGQRQIGSGLDLPKTFQSLLNLLKNSFLETTKIFKWYPFNDNFEHISVKMMSAVLFRLNRSFVKFASFHSS